MKIIRTESLPAESEKPDRVAPRPDADPCAGGVCASEPPAIARLDGRLVLVGTPYEVWEVIAAQARGEALPSVGPEHVRLAEAAYERAPADVERELARRA